MRSGIAQVPRLIRGTLQGGDGRPAAWVRRCSMLAAGQTRPRGSPTLGLVPSREPLLPAYLICGSDRPKVELAIRRLRHRVEEEGGAVEAYGAGGEAPVGPDEVAAACNALGLFGGVRLILVTGVEAWEKTPLDLLLAYIAAPAPDT